MSPKYESAKCTVHLGVNFIKRQGHCSKRMYSHFIFFFFSFSFCAVPCLPQFWML